MTDPDLLAAIRDLHRAIVVLTDELRHQRQTNQAAIEQIVDLHSGRPPNVVTK